MITIILIVFISLVSIFAFKNPRIHRSLMLNPYLFWTKKKYYQCITSGFVHKDAGHLLLNMYVLWMFWSTIEIAFKQIYNHATIAYILLFITGILVSSLIDVFMQKDNEEFNTLGASGGVSTVVFASITIFPMDKMGIIFFPVMIPWYIFGIIYLLYCVYKDYKNDDHINHLAHFIWWFWWIIFMILTWSWTLPNFIQQIHGY